MFQAEQKKIEIKILTILKTLDVSPIKLIWKPIPFNGEWGISTSFFSTAAAEMQKGHKTSVPQRAQEIAEIVKDGLNDIRGINRVEAIKGYLNLYFDSAIYSRKLIDSILDQQSRYGSIPPTGKRIMVEFSHPNTHKAFHVGHLRGTILGDSICRTLEFAGYSVVRANYPGDIGLHVIKWLWGYLKYHPGEQPSTDITKWMGEIYADSSKRLEENPDLEKEVRAIYARWDNHDPQVIKLWEQTREWSLEGFHQIYKALDVQFDVYYFNSQEEKSGKKIVEDLVQRGIATDERPFGGAVVVKLDDILGLKKEQFRTAVVLRSDGTALYATEDLALVKRKFFDYPDLEKSLYIVDVRQALHFTQVFKILEVSGYKKAIKCNHIPYELVILPGNVVMSSREGTVVLLEDLLREAFSRAKEETRKKNPALSEDQLESVAKAVGLGALKYPILARENTRIVTFDWNSALDFNGQAAPYIQYAHVRCNSILRKTSYEIKAGNYEFNYDMQPAEIQLIDLLSRFPTEVQRSATEYKPLIIATAAYDIAKAFSTFYDACPVMQAEKNVRIARLHLVKATKIALANALHLMGIVAPEVM